MPELDVDLVRLLALGLLGLIAIMLIAIVSSMGKLRKSIERAVSERAPESRWSSQEMAAEPPPEAVTVAHEPEPEEAEPEPEPQPAAAAPAIAAAPEFAQAHTSSQEPAQAAVAPAATASQPAAAAEPQPATAAQEEPQEQPFERDGRWWFRRGEELLVYEETSGQWVPAPQQAAVAAPAGGGPGVPTTIRDVAGVEPATQQEEAAPQQAGFWKCPSCGAVNGSTATTCRMCFAARP